MDREERDAALSGLKPEEIDPEFLPYLERINRLPYVVTTQCCVGHMPYEAPSGEAVDASARWGYLQLLLDQDAADWLNEHVVECGWVLLEESQLWTMYNMGDREFGRLPEVSEKGSVVLTPAWDASSWPEPAEDVCAILESYPGDRLAEGEAQP